MFGRARSYRNSTIDDQHEVERLRADVARLERALADVIAASDEALSDAGVQTSPVITEIRPDTGFAAAWTVVEVDTPTTDEDFFSRTKVDERARNWLLSSN